MTLARCVICGDSFSRRRRELACSVACAAENRRRYSAIAARLWRKKNQPKVRAADRRRRPPRRITRHCVYCGQKFTAGGTGVGVTLLCSTACRQAVKRLAMRVHKYGLDAPVIQCVICGAQVCIIRRGRHRTCSPDCAAARRRQTARQFRQSRAEARVAAAMEKLNERLKEQKND